MAQIMKLKGTISLLDDFNTLDPIKTPLRQPIQVSSRKHHHHSKRHLKQPYSIDETIPVINMMPQAKNKIGLSRQNMSVFNDQKNRRFMSQSNLIIKQAQDESNQMQSMNSSRNLIGKESHRSRNSSSHLETI